MKGKLIYFGDPMCSWCYGIAEQLDQLKIWFENQLDFELVMGGLRPGGGEEWNDTFKNFLREHWDHVQKTSGQAFSYGLLELDNFNYDTEPSCRAVRVIRDLKPEKEFAFFKACQHRFYFENENPLPAVFYHPICDKFGISIEKFDELFELSEYRELTKLDFTKSQQFGVRGFPSIVLNLEGRYHMIARGYSTFDKMKERVNAII